MSIAIRHYLKMDNIELIMNDSRCDVNLLINGAHPLTGIQGEPSFQLQILKLFLDNPNFNPNIGEPVSFEIIELSIESYLFFFRLYVNHLHMMDYQS